MRRVCLALMLFVLSTAASAIGQLDYVEHYQLAVEVDANGHITSVTPVERMPNAYLDVLRSNVMRWQFVPAQRNGHPVAVTTWLRVNMRVRTLPGRNVALQVLYVGNGPRVDAYANGSTYPPDFKRARVEAMFYLLATVETDGALDHVSLARAYTSRAYPATAVAAGLIDMVAHWKAKPMVVDGSPVAARIIIPLAFHLYETDILGRSTAYWRTDKLKLASDSPNLQGLPARLPATIAVLDDPITAQNNVPKAQDD